MASARPQQEEEGYETLERTVSEEVACVPKPLKTPAFIPRTSRQLETVIVNGYLFGFLPALEGKWSGGMQLSGSEEQQASSVKISYLETDGCWEVRTTTADKGGLAKREFMFLEPMAHGRCRVTVPEASLEMSYEEQSGDLFATVVQRCKLTGSLQRMEVWTLQTKGVNGEQPGLSRTVSVYSGGDLVSHAVARERRVL